MSAHDQRSGPWLEACTRARRGSSLQSCDLNGARTRVRGVLRREAGRPTTQG